MIDSAVGTDGVNPFWVDWINNNLTNGGHPLYMALYFLLIVGFTYFYTVVLFAQPRWGSTGAYHGQAFGDGYWAQVAALPLDAADGRVKLVLLRLDLALFDHGHGRVECFFER